MRDTRGSQPATTCPGKAKWAHKTWQVQLVPTVIGKVARISGQSIPRAGGSLRESDRQLFASYTHACLGKKKSCWTSAVLTESKQCSSFNIG
ncbi:hypothetical protein VTK73DRAFT_9956 [Phialemonium thermophilum]|uniref:Uncharacterized protein n=1 Tax=Phialemonium thermophilum TaxID=223376 RepID=A0ABR3XIC7_9PEZI